MDQFRCKVCGRVLGTVPRMCVCGNNNPALWEIVPDSFEQNAQNMNVGGYTQNAAPYLNMPQFTYPPADMNDYRNLPPEPPAGPNAEASQQKKNTVTVILAVLLALLLIGAGVLGYFTYQAYAESAGTSESGGSSRSRRTKKGAQEETQPESQAAPQDINVGFTPLNTPAAPGPTKLMKLPDFTGASYDSITRDVYYTDNLSLTKTEESSATIPAGAVISQSLSPGSIVNRGAALTLTVSTGPKTFTMPDMSGMTYAAASEFLSQYQIICVKEIKSNPGSYSAGTVAETFPGPGTLVSEGDTVQVFVWDETAAYVPPQPSSPDVEVSFHGVVLDIPRSVYSGASTIYDDYACFVFGDDMSLTLWDLDGVTYDYVNDAYGSDLLFFTEEILGGSDANDYDSFDVGPTVHVLMASATTYEYFGDSAVTCNSDYYVIFFSTHCVVVEGSVPSYHSYSDSAELRAAMESARI